MKMDKSLFEKEAEVSVSDKTWNRVLAEVVKSVKEKGDTSWNACVKLAKHLEQQEQHLEQQEQTIQELKTQLSSRQGEEKPRQFLVLSASEVAKDPQLRAQFRQYQVAEEPCRGGFIAQKFYLEFVLAAREFEPLNDKDKIVKKVEKLGEVLSVSARADKSLFNNGYLDEEAPQSAVGSELFRLAIDLLRPDRCDKPVPDLKITHQQHLVSDIGNEHGFEIIRKSKKRDSTGNAKKEEKKAVDQIDICAWFVHPCKQLGACVLAACEYKPSNIKETERKAQADMYGSNILILHQKQCVVIDIAGANDLKSWKVSAYGLVKAEFSSEPHSWEKSPLYSGSGAEAIVMVAYGLLQAQKSFPSRLEQYGKRLSPVVGVIGDFVYKVYDNAQTRKPNIEVVRDLLDSEAELLSSADKSLEIVKMKHIESDWKEGGLSSQIFEEIIAQLRRLHEQYGPHGDIRLANLLSCGKIIDFDFVRAESYPSTINSISQDGRRHEKVEHMIERVKKGDKMTLKPHEDHDWYSLGQVMRLFRPEDDTKASLWESLCNKVEKGQTISDSEFQVGIIRLKDNNIPLPGTGHTPVKKQPVSNKNI